MAKTIGNPVSWFARSVGSTGGHISESAAYVVGQADMAEPQVRTLELEDIRHALRAGVQDFMASRTDAMFAVLVYPIIGLLLIGLGLQKDLLPLMFPLISGFALLGPVAAVGLYELSRRREAGLEANWGHALGFIGSPSFGAILVLGIYMTGIFFAWMLTAGAILAVTMGTQPPASAMVFARDVLTTGPGWMMIILGFGVGFFFALGVLAMSVVSFPLLLDRNVGVQVAIATSIKVTKQNPRVVLTWGAIVAAGLVLGSLPMFLGLIVVMPILGHATWHFYRRAVK